MNKKLFIKHNTCMKRIIYYSILIFVFSCFIGFFYARIWKNNNEEVAKDNIISNANLVAETVSDEEKISFNSSFAIKKYYHECGHQEINYAELPIEFVNLTKSEIEELYPDWKVEEFSSNSIILSQEKDCMCNEHYVLKLDDDTVDVYHIEENGDESLYQDTNIYMDYLTNEDISNLKNGIYIYGKENISSVIEDFE